MQAVARSISAPLPSAAAVRLLSSAPGRRRDSLPAFQLGRRCLPGRTPVVHVPCAVAKHAATRCPPPQQDADTQVQWWLLSICDPQAWTPGLGEAAGLGRPDSWPKFRNLIVR